MLYNRFTQSIRDQVDSSEIVIVKEDTPPEKKSFKIKLSIASVVIAFENIQFSNGIHALTAPPLIFHFNTLKQKFFPDFPLTINRPFLEFYYYWKL